MPSPARLGPRPRLLKFALTAPFRETLVGSVERVTFHNEENGFAVLKVKACGRRDLVVVGHAAFISAGEFIHAVGVWLIDRAQGLQFKADTLKTIPPTTELTGFPGARHDDQVNSTTQAGRSGEEIRDKWLKC